VQIADAKNLSRTLALTAQLAAMEKPMILVLNMWDEARARGISEAPDHAGALPESRVAPGGKGRAGPRDGGVYGRRIRDGEAPELVFGIGRGDAAKLGLRPAPLPHGSGVTWTRSPPSTPNASRHCFETSGAPSSRIPRSVTARW